jgi:hypothetical protein
MLPMIIVEAEVCYILDPNYAPMFIVETEVCHILDPNYAHMIIVETEVCHSFDANYAPMIIVETEVCHILDPDSQEYFPPRGSISILGYYYLLFVQLPQNAAAVEMRMTQDFVFSFFERNTK